MVNFKIFAEAAFAYNSGDVWLIGVTPRAANFIVQDVPIRVEITPTGTRFQCQCEHHKQHMLQDKLCKRIIAVTMYLYFKKGKIRKVV
jgi:hypothetical protein